MSRAPLLQSLATLLFAAATLGLVAAHCPQNDGLCCLWGDIENESPFIRTSGDIRSELVHGWEEDFMCQDLEYLDESWSLLIWWAQGIKIHGAVDAGRENYYVCATDRECNCTSAAPTIAGR